MISIDRFHLEEMEMQLCKAKAICDCIEDATKDHVQIALAVAIEIMDDLCQELCRLQDEDRADCLVEVRPTAVPPFPVIPATRPKRGAVKAG